jgi:predicted RNA-binding protein with PUA-like domain
MAKRYWLMKVEPSAYTIDDLERDGSTNWEGVRNYKARNYLKNEMQVGDEALFYASNAEPSGVTGLARIVKAGYPDGSAFDKKSHYYDEDSDRTKPTWYQVDIGFARNFHGTVALDTLKATKGLEAMGVIKKGNRLSVQPVTKSEFDIVVKLAKNVRT